MLTPFSFMTAFAAERHQFQTDIAASLYSPLACHLALTVAGEWFPDHG